jgi:ethanolamine utilization protein EutA
MSEARESAVVDVGASTVFNSVGIDVGSSTTHLILSRLGVGWRDSHFHRKPEILERQTIYRSPVIFTPFLDDSTIDHDAVLAFVQGSYREAGMAFEEVSTGAVICTGEAARRKNAQAITRALAKDSGKFVCATAGHHFEAMLAAHGSGSVELSHYFDGAVVNLDIGGGTSKRALIRDGAIEDTAAINVGARLVVFDADGTVRRAEPAGRAIAATLGIDVSPGRRLSFDQQHDFAGAMARLIVAFLGLEPLPPLARELLVTDPPAPLPDRLIMSEPPHCVPKPFRLVCSGGVSEFLYEGPEFETGDLGPLLGRALRRELRKRIPESWVVHPREGIRATVIGACEFTLQVSGDTVYASDDSVLPLSNAPVISVPIDWSKVTADDVAAATRKALDSADQSSLCALFYGGPRQFGYGRLAELARGIAAGCRECRGETIDHDSSGLKRVFVFSHNIANTLGRELHRHLLDTPFLCIDEIEVGDLDYLDIGIAPAGENYLPVVVKSLVFQSSGAQRKRIDRT